MKRFLLATFLLVSAAGANSIPAMAAAYLFHLCQNHPFIDGNKRVGANAAITFLLLNNWEPTFAEEELVDLVLSVASVDCTSRG